MEWIRVEERTPNTYETGDWDGQRSDLVVFRTKNKEIKLGRLYEGFMDGGHFEEWADDRDYTINEHVVAWLELPD